ncbi:MAG: prepilin-type N-terminal cleavage/methylation domain-containing protein [Paucibacter sp.]|nr:prepilin-type N-terminal cleavage/methylation domain-containing protein [Roseateles sp.]
MPQRRPAPTRQTGFTLIELMIAVAIIAIIAAVALPAYTSYVTRSHIPEATSQLSSRQTMLEQFYQDNHTYVGAPACTNASTSNNFTLSCTGAGAPTATSYVLTATGIGPMTGFTYTVDQSGNKATTIASSWTGWTGSTSCWITNKGGAC